MESNCYKFNKPLTFLEYIENHNNFKHVLKTDSKVTVDHDLVWKSNRIAIPSDFQNHVIPLKVYFPKYIFSYIRWNKSIFS